MLNSIIAYIKDVLVYSKNEIKRANSGECNLLETICIGGVFILAPIWDIYSITYNIFTNGFDNIGRPIT